MDFVSPFRIFVSGYQSKVATRIFMWLLWLPIEFTSRQGIERKVWIAGGIVSKHTNWFTTMSHGFGYTMNTFQELH